MTELERIASAAEGVAGDWAALAPDLRADVLIALASSVEAAGDELAKLAQGETGLGRERLQGELKRTTVQARLFADVTRRGEYLDVRIDDYDPQFVLGARPDLRRYRVAIGPVLNYAASNFPFAFSVFGGDTVSALAAGCPVIVKLNPGHLQLGERMMEVLRTALHGTGQAVELLQSVVTEQDGVELLKDERIRAATFTGSTAVGQLLARVAAERPTPIPFYGELGSVNPSFVLTEALRSDAEGIAKGLATSVGASAGQLCTKPGFVFIPAGATSFEGHLKEALSDIQPHRLLTPSISKSFQKAAEDLRNTDGTTVVVAGDEQLEEGLGWVTPTVVRVEATHLANHPELADETFGPLTVLVTYNSVEEAVATATALFPGNLTSTLHAAPSDAESAIQAILQWSADHAGRVLFGGWPTGVAVTAAQHHGGPWPSTTNALATSVGTAAIDRFLRPVTYQNVPDRFLPEPLRDDNPWRVPQARNVDGPSTEWGGAT